MTWVQSDGGKAKWQPLPVYDSMARALSNLYTDQSYGSIVRRVINHADNYGAVAPRLFDGVGLAEPRRLLWAFQLARVSHYDELDPFTVADLASWNYPRPFGRLVLASNVPCLDSDRHPEYLKATCVRDGDIYDTWDCGLLFVSEVWVAVRDNRQVASSAMSAAATQ